MTTAPRYTLRNVTAPQYRLVLAAWTCVALFLPVYRVLPGGARTIWFGAALGLIVVSLALGRIARPLFPALWIVAGYGAVIAIFTATGKASVSENFFNGAQLLVLLGCGPFALRWLVLNIPGFTQRMTAAFLIGQTISSAAGIAQIAGTPVLGWSSIQGRAPGLASHPNVLGLLSSIAILICVHSLVHGSRRRLVVAIAAAINLGGLLATGSLSSLIAGALGLLVMALSLRDRIKHLTRLIAGAVIAAWLVLTYTDFVDSLRTPADRYMQVTGQTGAESTWEIRQRTYAFAWEAIIKEPLFGIGLPAKYGATFDGVTVTHNFFLRSWYQAGIALAVPSAMIVLAVLIVAWRSLRVKDNSLAAGVLVTVMGFALTSAFFEQPDYWLPALLAWSVLAPRSKPEVDKLVAARPKSDIVTSSPVRAGASAGCSLPGGN